MAAGASRVGTLLLLLLPLVAWARCEEAPAPSCEEAVQATFERCGGFPYGLPPSGPGTLSDDPVGTLRYCEDTLAAAEAAGCEKAHARFRSCLAAPRHCVDGLLTQRCTLEEAALHACLGGQTAFELECGNGKDDDRDGRIDCMDPDCLSAWQCSRFWGLSLPQSAERDVDMLFVIDNSGSMADEQAMLQAQFTALMQELRNITGGLPNVHLGVTSTDLGTGAFPITYCEEVGGDQGNLLTGSCTNPTGAPYIVDVEPSSCEVTKNDQGICSAHTCSQANCAHETSTTFVVDAATQCPRCRNYAGQELEDVFTCIGGLGTLGCGFEQPLESMYKALDTSNAANSGFIRENAFLAIVLITDEDDCSAANPQLFDNSQTDINSTLGPLTSFRCFEFGITCDQNGRTAQGLRTGCVPREDPGALLHPVSRYTNFLQALKDPQMLVVAAIAGPASNQQVTVGLDDYSQPELQFSCSTERGGAVPGIRIKQVVEAFNTEEDMSWAYSSVCSPTFTDALQGIGRKIRDILEFQCLPSPLKGCSDPGAELGMPRDTCEANDVCRPICRVREILHRGTSDEELRFVPPCLEVCESGECPGNTDRSLAYAGGHPPRRDANLPVEACWQVGYQESCPNSNFAELLVSRRADPPPRTFLEASCVQISQREQLCNDGADNDEDCLVDLDDPDCH